MATLHRRQDGNLYLRANISGFITYQIIKSFQYLFDHLGFRVGSTIAPGAVEWMRLNDWIYTGESGFTVDWSWEQLDWDIDLATLRALLIGETPRRPPLRSRQILEPWTVGNLVDHSTFGVGIIEKREPRYLTIYFENIDARFHRRFGGHFLEHISRQPLKKTGQLLGAPLR